MAVAVVVAAEEAAFPMAVQRVVGGIEVEDQFLGYLRMDVEEEFGEVPLDRASTVVDAVIAMRTRGRVLQPVWRDLPASGAWPGLRAPKRPSTTPSTGSWRSASWSIRFL